jgi:nicotinate dehydrogenase subunit A
MSRLSLKVNGRTRAVDVDPDCPLLYVLRDDLSLDNPRFGCGLGQCGACTVIIDKRAVRSCQITARAATGKDVTTLEGIGTAEQPHRLQRALVDAQAFQCGYCLNGWVMTAKALLESNPHPTEAQMRTAFDGLVCRCGSHVRILDAVRQAAASQGRVTADIVRDPQGGPGVTRRSE